MNEKKQDNLARIATEKPLKLIISFCVPTMLTMLATSLYNMVDRVFVGNGVGYLGITAITLSNVPMMLINTLALLVGIGGAAFLSMEFGAGRRENSRGIVGTAISLQIIIGVAVSIAGLIFLEDICYLIGASDESLPYTKDYLGVILIGAIPMCINGGIITFVRADGNPRLAMVFSMAGTVLNVILDPLFIYTFGLGVMGAAIATVISTLLSTVLILAYFFTGKKGNIHLKISDLKISFRYVKSMTRLGLATFFRQLATSSMVLVMNRTLVYYANLSDVGGDVAVSSMGISTTIGSLIAMVGIGMEQGTVPLLAYNHGAKNPLRVRKILVTSMVFLFSILMVCYVIMMSFPKPLIGLFGETANMDFAVWCLRVYNIALPTMTFQMLGTAFFQATDRPKIANVLSIVRPLGLMIPLLLILPRFFGLNAVIAVAPIADTISAVVTVVLLAIILRREDIIAAVDSSNNNAHVDAPRPRAKI